MKGRLPVSASTHPAHTSSLNGEVRRGSEEGERGGGGVRWWWSKAME